MLSKSLSVPPLTAGKKTHVFLSHDWGINGDNHRRVMQVSEALNSRGLLTWIDEERSTLMEILDGIDHTECLLVFITENYVKKLDDENFVAMDFNYGFNKFGADQTIIVVLEEAMRNQDKWGKKLRFLLGSVLYFDLSGISDASPITVNIAMDTLYHLIIQKIAGQNKKIAGQNEFQVSPVLNQLVRWNRGKIMLVGQGRAGKTALANNLVGMWIPETPSTVGAEQFDVKLFYGGANGGKLKPFDQPEAQLESFLAEPYSHESLPPLDSAVNGTVDNEKQLLESFELNPHDFNPEQVLHYKELQEIEMSSKYKLTLIDFGGQSVFNVLHAFFMSKYSIYLVVFDMELFLSPDQDKRSSCLREMNFWLSTIALHAFDSETGKTAPVAIVGTRGDVITTIEQYQIISDEIKHLFEHKSIWGNLLWYEDKDVTSEKLCFFPNNNTLIEDNIVREQLLRNIERKFDESNFMKKDIPLLWIKIFDDMKSSKQSYLSYDELIEIATRRLSNQTIEIHRMLLYLDNMLRFLNKLGMIFWIDDEDILKNIIILDPIHYFVKPATIIICKHIPTKDEPYEVKTMHRIPKIHGESEEKYKTDWNKMVKFGLVSDILADDLLKRYYRNQGLTDDENQRSVIKSILLLMEQYGLAVRIKGSVYRLIPALLPFTPTDIDQKNSSLRALCRFLDARYGQLMKLFPVGMHFSLFFHLPREGGGCCRVLSLTNCKQHGFLPHGLFERLICRCIHTVSTDSSKPSGDNGGSNHLDEELDMNEFGFRGKAQFLYKYHRVRLINNLEENRIEVLIESKFRGNNLREEKLKLQEIYKIIMEETDQVLRECYERLIVETYVHPPDSADFTLTKSVSEEKIGLFSLHKLRLLLQPCDLDADTFEHSFLSEDGVEVVLVPQKLKISPYWSMWKDEVTLTVSETVEENQEIYEPYPLSKGKTTHVFLSHDWGIDKRNHELVKQLGQTLQRKGLKVWIDDGIDEGGNRRITTQLDHKIAKAIEETECMLAFITRNYISKVNGDKVTDFCKKELSFGLDELNNRVIPVIVDSKVPWPLNGTIKFKFPDFLYHDMSLLFDSTTPLSNQKIAESIDQLFQLILDVIGLPQRSLSQMDKIDEKFTSSRSELFIADNKKKRKKKRKKNTDDDEKEEDADFTVRQKAKELELEDPELLAKIEEFEQQQTVSNQKPLHISRNDKTKRRKIENMKR